MGNYTILQKFENSRGGRQARNFTTNAPKILDLKSSSEQIFSRKLPLGAPEIAPALEPLKKRILPLSFFYKEQQTANSKAFKIAQKTAFEAKGLQYTTGKVIQH